MKQKLARKDDFPQERRASRSPEFFPAEQDHGQALKHLKGQLGEMLAVLIRARGAFVSAWEISAALGILQFTARIHELRRLGFRIENRMETMADGSRHSWYRLLPGMNEPPPSKEISKPSQEKANAGGDVRPRPAPSSLPSLLSTSPPKSNFNSDDWYVAKTGKPRPSVSQESLFAWERQ